MKVYRIRLSYYNSYHDFKLDMDGRVFRRVGDTWTPVELVEDEPDEEFILFFERVYTHYMRKLTFNDIVTADEYDLELWSYQVSGDILSFHRIDWHRPIPPTTSMHIYILEGGRERILSMEYDEGVRYLANMGVEVDI